MNWLLFVDAALIVLYFVLIVWIGLSMGRRDKSFSDFALGGRRVPWWAVMASIIAAETSAATFLGAPGEGYKFQSIAYAQLVIGLIIGRMLVGYIFLKPYYEYKVYTVYDFVGIRFGNKTRNYTSILFLIMRTLASGTRMFVPSIVMVIAYYWFKSGGEGVSYTAMQEQLVATQNVMPYVWCILILVALTGLYTCIGGIKAVIWTDVVQACLMFGSAIVACVTIIYHLSGDTWNFAVGFAVLKEKVPYVTQLRGYFHLGWEPWYWEEWFKKQAAPEIGRTGLTQNAWEFVRMTLGSEFTLFSATIGAILGNMAAFGTDQDMVQRLLTAETYQKSRRSLITAAVMDLPIAAIFSFIGVLLYAYYIVEPEFKPVSHTDVFASYIVNVMPTGVRGLVLAGVFATAMGSLSAALNALATSFTNDWYITKIAPGRTERHYVMMARVFTVMFAVLMVMVASGTAYIKVVNPEFRIIPFVIGIAGMLLGPMLGVFLTGMLTKRRGSDLGNVFAITVGLVVIFFLSGQYVNFVNDVVYTLNGYPAYVNGQGVKFMAWSWLPIISWTWYAAIGGGLVFAISLLFRTPEHIVRAAEQTRARAMSGTEDVPVHMRLHE